MKNEEDCSLPLAKYSPEQVVKWKSSKSYVGSGMDATCESDGKIDQSSNSADSNGDILGQGG